ncbi:MAG: hypothetical protein R3C16_06570 [Hyphomonadaceae bacterium]
MPQRDRNLFREWLGTYFPDPPPLLAISIVRQMHGGRDYDQVEEASARRGPSRLIADRFARATRRLGASTSRAWRRPHAVSPPVRGAGRRWTCSRLKTRPSRNRRCAARAPSQPGAVREAEAGFDIAPEGGGG